MADLLRLCVTLHNPDVKIVQELKDLDSHWCKDNADGIKSAWLY